MLNYKKIFSTAPFSVEQKKKDPWYFKEQKKLSLYHYNNCVEYRKISDRIFVNIKQSKNLSELPFVHTEMFKKFNLRSVNDAMLSKTFKSSGTSNVVKSKINLDKKTSLLQSRALSNIFLSFFKSRKSTIFFVDSSEVLNSKNILSARGAAVQGFRQLVKKHFFLLDKNFNLKIQKLKDFITKNPNEEFIIFGFTSLVWTYLVKELLKKKIILPKNNGVLIHGGGWKKIQDQKVDKKIFNSRVKQTAGTKSIHNYYGMVEQTGSIFIECEYGKFHSSIYSEVFIRDSNLKLSRLKTDGLIQILSLLPLSYPGHNILTEDLGSLEGIDDCKCGRKGKYFSVKGRAPNTDIRGCSDTH